MKLMEVGEAAIQLTSLFVAPLHIHAMLSAEYVLPRTQREDGQVISARREPRNGCRAFRGRRFVLKGFGGY